MAKARSRTVARKVKDRWKSKNWYNIQAPPSFDNVTIADTLTDKPNNLINRVTEVSLQDLTNDFRKSHIKLYFKIDNIDETNAHTKYIGHSLTSDYLRRMIRRKRSKIEGVYDVTTKDGAIVRVKPFATTDKRIQNSQKKVVRETMKKTVYDQAKTDTLSEFVKNIIDGKIGSDIYKGCKKLYPVKRVEIFKTEVVSYPKIKIEHEKTTKILEKSETEEMEDKDKKISEKKEKISKEKSKKSKIPVSKSKKFKKDQLKKDKTIETKKEKIDNKEKPLKKSKTKKVSDPKKQEIKTKKKTITKEKNTKE